MIIMRHLASMDHKWLIDKLYKLKRSCVCFQGCMIAFTKYKVQVMKPNASCVDSLNIFPFLISPQVLSELKAKAIDVDLSFNLLSGGRVLPRKILVVAILICDYI